MAASKLSGYPGYTSAIPVTYTSPSDLPGMYPSGYSAEFIGQSKMATFSFKKRVERIDWKKLGKSPKLTLYLITI